MGVKDQNQKKSFEVVQEGMARARFGGVFGAEPVRFADGIVAGVTGPVSFAPVEDNGGLSPEEYFVCNARLLSKAVTPYRKFDFTQGNVLKDAVPLFDGLTLYANHWADVENWKGKVLNPVWDEKNVPNGINALVAFDRVVDPKLARGAETKALRSFSVTIWFEFVKSHPDLANFFDRLGEEVDGEVVRLIVTKITNAGELSVVWEGEDPYAKSFNAGGEPPVQPEGEEKTMKLNAATIALLGIAADTDITPALLEGKIGELGTKIGALETKVTALEPDAQIGQQVLTETRERAMTLYKTLKGDKFSQDFCEGVIAKANLKTARALVSEFEEAIDKTVPLTCTKCGEPVARRSSHESSGGGSHSSKNVDDYRL